MRLYPILSTCTGTTSFIFPDSKITKCIKEKEKNQKVNLEEDIFTKIVASLYTEMGEALQVKLRAVVIYYDLPQDTHSGKGKMPIFF